MRKTLIISISLVALLALGFFLYLWKNGPAKNELPNLMVAQVDGTHVQVHDIKDENIALILFQPDCDHCQREASRIQEHIKDFDDYVVYFISADSLSNIREFASKYHLDTYANLHFGQTTVKSIIGNFGEIMAPSIYIYSDRKLKNHFSGEAPIEDVLEAL